VSATLLVPKKVSSRQNSKIQKFKNSKVGASGNYHIQAYIELDYQRSGAYIRTIPGLEHSSATVNNGADAAANYPFKNDETSLPGTAWSWGTRKTQGKRSDLTAVKRAIDQGESNVNLWDGHFSQMVRYHKSFDVYKRVKQTPRNFKTVVIMLIGPSMTGKSTTARLLTHMLGTVYAVPEPKGSGLYFDGYDGQDVLFFDEFDGHFMKPTFFNQLCDAGPMLLPVHGGAGLQVQSRYIVLCTNYAPKFWWRRRNKAQVFQTTRRIDVIIPMFRVGPAPYDTDPAPLGNWPQFAGNHPAFNPGPSIPSPPPPASLYPPTQLQPGSQSLPIEIPDEDPHWYQPAQDPDQDLLNLPLPEPVEWMDNSFDSNEYY